MSHTVVCAWIVAPRQGWAASCRVQRGLQHGNGSGHLSDLWLEKGGWQVSEPRQSLLLRPGELIHLFLQHSVTEDLPCVASTQCLSSVLFQAAYNRAIARMAQWQSWDSNPSHALLLTLVSLPGPCTPFHLICPGLLIHQTSRHICPQRLHCSAPCPPQAGTLTSSHLAAHRPLLLTVLNV